MKPKHSGQRVRQETGRNVYRYGKTESYCKLTMTWDVEWDGGTTTSVKASRLEVVPEDPETPQAGLFD